MDYKFPSSSSHHWLIALRSLPVFTPTRIKMATNSNQNAPDMHPLKATAEAISGGVQGERRAPRMSHMQSANEGPADIIAKVSGAAQGGKRVDDGAYFTNNEGHPFPDP